MAEHRRRPSLFPWRAALLFTLAICGLHFTAMAAAGVYPDPDAGSPGRGDRQRDPDRRGGGDGGDHPVDQLRHGPVRPPAGAPCGRGGAADPRLRRRRDRRAGGDRRRARRRRQSQLPAARRLSPAPRTLPGRLPGPVPAASTSRRLTADGRGQGDRMPAGARRRQRVRGRGADAPAELARRRAVGARGARHQRAQGGGGADRPPRLSRHADRPCPTAPCSPSICPQRRARQPSRTNRSPCSASISTASRRSTTFTAIRPATQLLVAVANRLRSVVRGDELVARLGGDEFAIVQYGGSPAGACRPAVGAGHRGARGTVPDRRPPRCGSAPASASPSSRPMPAGPPT